MTPKPLNFLPIIFQLLLEIIEISQRLHFYLSTSKHIYIFWESINKSDKVSIFSMN